MDNILTIKLKIQPGTDREKLGEAIAALIKVVTPSEDLADAISNMTEQIYGQLQLMQEEEGDRKYTQEELEAAFDEPSTFEQLMMGECPPGWKPFL